MHYLFVFIFCLGAGLGNAESGRNLLGIPLELSFKEIFSFEIFEFFLQMENVPNFLVDNSGEYKDYKEYRRHCKLFDALRNYTGNFACLLVAKMWL